MTELEITKLKEYHRQIFMLMTELNNFELTVSRLRNELLEIDKITIDKIDVAKT